MHTQSTAQATHGRLRTQGSRQLRSDQERYEEVSKAWWVWLKLDTRFIDRSNSGMSIFICNSLFINEVLADDIDMLDDDINDLDYNIESEKRQTSKQPAEAQRAQQQRLEEQRIKEQQAKKQQMEGQRAEELRAEEQNMEEQRVEEQHAKKQCAEEQHAEEQRAEEQWVLKLLPNATPGRRTYFLYCLPDQAIYRSPPTHHPSTITIP